MRRRPPHILVTTPESLYILLGSRVRPRRCWRPTRTVIVDEIHAVAPNKRGAHLALSLERLAALVRRPPAAHRPVGDAEADRGRSRASWSAPAPDGTPRPSATIVDTGHAARAISRIEVPRVAARGGDVGARSGTQIYDRLAELIEAHRTTLVFVNTRRMAERVARQLSERLGEEHVDRASRQPGARSSGSTPSSG